jgi:putative MATE family efflux protein
MQKGKTFTEGSIFKALIALSIPVVFSNILHSAYQLIDTYWVGRLGAEAVAAVSLSFPVIFLMFAIGGGITIAGSILVAQHIGAGNHQKADHVSGQTITMIFAIVIPLTIIGWFASESLMRLMGAEASVLPMATSYLQISFLGLIFVFGFFAFQSLLRGVGDVKTPIYIVLTTVILNAILDPLFIFGYGPIPAYGVTGAAIATLLTQAVATIVGLFILFSGKYGIHLKLHEMKPDGALIRDMVKLGIPASVEQSMRALGLTVMTFLVASFGTTVIASYGIGSRILSFIIIPAFGLSMATATVIAQNIGAGKADRAERTAQLSAIIGFVSLTLIGILVYFFARPIAATFITGDPQALEGSILFVRIMSLSFGFLGAQLALGGAFQGSGNTFASMMLTMISIWVLQFPLAYILALHTNLAETGIWIAFPVSNVIIAVITYIWFRTGSWKKKQITTTTPLEDKVLQEAMIEEGIPTQ